jgi:hypothetical protein
LVVDAVEDALVELAVLAPDVVVNFHPLVEGSGWFLPN